MRVAGRDFTMPSPVSRRAAATISTAVDRANARMLTWRRRARSHFAQVAREAGQTVTRRVVVLNLTRRSVETRILGARRDLTVGAAEFVSTGALVGVIQRQAALSVIQTGLWRARIFHMLDVGFDDKIMNSNKGRVEIRRSCID